ncbi:MAG: isoprenylcysteine carboxylmethyltransferase family protein [Elusimicrobiota bacterium]
MQKIKGDVSAGWITKVIFLFYILVFLTPSAEIFIIKREINYYISAAALIVYFTGMFFWLWAIKTLNQYWSIEIEIRDEHPLIKSGPYRYFRHPHYLFIFCELFGLPLIANAYYSLILMAMIFIPLIVLRIIYEEKALINKFGDKYREYQKEVWGLFPISLFKKGVRV